jgi:Zn-dependent protease
MHLTFPLIFVWAALNFGLLDNQGWEGAAFGLVVTVALFLIVLLHELGHSLAAQRFGHVGVERIVLLPIGGVAQMDDLPEEPGKEFLISGSGPFVNLIIAGLMSAGALLAGQSLDIGQWFQDTSYLGQLQFWAIFRYIFLTNIFIGVFNLLPAFPMDGGRLLRSVLARRMDFVRATKIAASVGQSLAWGLGLVGFLSGNFLLILVAIFIYAGAAQEQKETEISQVLSKMRVSDIYSRDVATLSPQSTVDEAVNITLQSLQANFPICDQDKLVGLVTYPT